MFLEQHCAAAREGRRLLAKPVLVNDVVRIGTAAWCAVCGCVDTYRSRLEHTPVTGKKVGVEILVATTHKAAGPGEM